MIVFFDKSNGNIVATFPEMYALPKDFWVTVENRPKTDFDYRVLSPDDAKDFEDPRHPDNVHKFKINKERLVDSRNRVRKMKQGVLKKFVFPKIALK